jgi:hypothetical protein
MELARTEAKFFGLANLPLVEIPHHPSGGARAGEHRADAEGAIESVGRTLTSRASLGGKDPPPQGGKEEDREEETCRPA